jgi:hypothetical protein
MIGAIFCGSRKGQGQEVVSRAMGVLISNTLLAGIPKFDYLVVGSDRGTDREVWNWAMENEWPALVCPAKWKTGKPSGPAAGPCRNRFMFRWVDPRCVFGFAGDRGTSDMMTVACEGGARAYWWNPYGEFWALDERVLGRST